VKELIGWGNGWSIEFGFNCKFFLKKKKTFHSGVTSLNLPYRECWGCEIELRKLVRAIKVPIFLGNFPFRNNRGSKPRSMDGGKKISQ